MFARQITNTINALVFFPWSITPLGFFDRENCFKFRATNRLGERPSLLLELHSRTYDFMEIEQILLQLLTEAVKEQDEIIRTYSHSIGQGYW